ncbi:PA2169 family four-helix-bundle protein [Pedobacter sp. GR22-6]|uniref:PA2169 family four-helix-bundle protein n=1 Tax=Pedobacter sp. GR22-6 TaxID=3127957 RepID=UPI00307F8B7E
MEANTALISDLQGLVNILNDGKEGYLYAAQTTQSDELSALFMKYNEQREEYAEELKTHIEAHGGNSENEGGGILGALHRTWIDIKQALSSHEYIAVLETIETGEKAAIEKFDLCIADYANHADHLNLLKRQRAGIAAGLAEIKAARERLELEKEV